MALKVLVTYTMKEGKRDDFLKAVIDGGLREQVLAENGCLQYDYYITPHNENTILLVERWESRDAQKVHLEQPHMAGVRQAKELYTINTELEFYDI